MANAAVTGATYDIDGGQQIVDARRRPWTREARRAQTSARSRDAS
jgi:hypothetical protein